MDLKLLATTFLEGLLSFFSPCVLPLIPLYMSYLAGNNKSTDEEGNIRYQTGKVFITTLFFVLGICMTFVLLALSLSYISTFLEDYREVISIIGGVLLILFGLHECGIISIDVLNKEFRLKIDQKLNGMNPFKAFLLGFVFSLGWSPCIGPLLSGALLLAATSAKGYLYIISYGLGLIIPFLMTGLFTGAVLNFISKNKKIVSYVSKITGVILICFGLYMIWNASKDIKAAKELKNAANSKQSEDASSYLFDREFKDIEGNKVVLSDLKGEYVLFNFSATWCMYCDMELPDLTEFSKEGLAKCYVVMTPLNENGGMEDIEKFAEERDLEIPLLVDEEGVLFYYCGVSSYPTTYVIDPDGEFLCYASGAMSKEGFEGLLDYAKGLYEEKAK